MNIPQQRFTVGHDQYGNPIDSDEYGNRYNADGDMIEMSPEYQDMLQADEAAREAEKREFWGFVKRTWDSTGGIPVFRRPLPSLGFMGTGLIIFFAAGLLCGLGLMIEAQGKAIKRSVSGFFGKIGAAISAFFAFIWHLIRDLVMIWPDTVKALFGNYAILGGFRSFLIRLVPLAEILLLVWLIREIVIKCKTLKRLPEMSRKDVLKPFILFIVPELLFWLLSIPYQDHIFWALYDYLCLCAWAVLAEWVTCRIIAKKQGL